MALSRCAHLETPSLTRYDYQIRGGIPICWVSGDITKDFLVMLLLTHVQT